MSGSNRTEGFSTFFHNESGWADFFITRLGLILFASILLIAASGIYPIFKERESRLYLGTIASDVVSKIEAVDSMTIPEYKYNYVFDENIGIITIEISTEYVIAHANVSTSLWGEREIIHAEPLITHVYPPNSKWNNTSGFRKYLSDVMDHGKNGDISSPLDLETDKRKVEMIFGSITKELAKSPFKPDLNEPMFIEKVMIYYKNQSEIKQRDYVFIYQ